MRTLLLIILAVILASAVVNAQSPVVTETRQMYTMVKNNFVRMAEKMPAEDFSFKPVAEIRSFGELMAHMADSQARTCAGVLGQQKSVDAASKKTKDEIVAALKASFEICDAAWDSLTPANFAEIPEGARRSRLGTLVYNLGHENEEYGYGAVYLRLKNIVPPSSDRSAPMGKK